MTDKKPKATNRGMKSFRLSTATIALLKALAEHLTVADGIRIVSETEVVERAIHALAEKMGIK